MLKAREAHQIGADQQKDGKFCRERYVVALGELTALAGDRKAVGRPVQEGYPSQQARCMRPLHGCKVLPTIRVSRVPAHVFICFLAVAPQPLPEWGMLMDMRRSSSRAFASAVERLKAQSTFIDGASVDEACSINIYIIPPAVGISFQLLPPASSLPYAPSIHLGE